MVGKSSKSEMVDGMEQKDFARSTNGLFEESRNSRAKGGGVDDLNKIQFKSELYLI